jgi:DNA-directed RNA polymerase subunit RPC12/RpoP
MEARCSRCGNAHRLTEIKGRIYCFECEKDIALQEIGLLRD